MVLPKACALLHVLGGVHERALGQADAPGGHDRAHGVEAQHGQAEPAHLADDVLGRDAHVVEQQLAGVDAPHPHLVVGAAHRRRPSQARSTMKAVIESWARLVGSPVLAKTVYQSASRTPDIQHLVPLSTQSPVRPDPVSGTARVRMPTTSLPACGLGQPEAGPQVAGGDARQVALLLLLVAGDQDRPRGQPGQQEHQGGGVGVLGHLLDGDGQAEDARPRAPELDREAQAEEVGVPERLEDVGRVVAGRCRWRGPAA